MSEQSSDVDMSRNPDLLCRHRAHLIIIDVQEKLLPVIAENELLVKRIRFLKDVAATLGVPVDFTEQYPKGLGHTIEALVDSDTNQPAIEKISFSAAAVLQEGACPLGSAGSPSGVRDQYLLVGIETHICVLQTALDLVGRGHRVFVVADAVGARANLDHQIAVSRMRDAGVVLCTAESAAFEMCETAAAEEFREISKLVRQAAASTD